MPGPEEWISKARATAPLNNSVPFYKGEGNGQSEYVPAAPARTQYKSAAERMAELYGAKPAEDAPPAEDFAETMARRLYQATHKPTELRAPDVKTSPEEYRRRAAEFEERQLAPQRSANKQLAEAMAGRVPEPTAAESEHLVRLYSDPKYVQKTNRDRELGPEWAGIYDRQNNYPGFVGRVGEVSPVSATAKPVRSAPVQNSYGYGDSIPRPSVSRQDIINEIARQRSLMKPTAFQSFR